MSTSRRLTRRELLRGAASLGVSALAAACAPAATPPPAAPVAKATERAKPAADGGKCGVTAPGQYPIVKDRVTLTVFFPQSPFVKDMFTNEFTVKYEERTNVHIDWQLVPQQGLAEKRNLVLASGQYPDVFMAAAISREDQVQYGEQGVLIPLNDLIDNGTVHLKKVLTDFPDHREDLTSPNGKIYALGSNRRDIHTKTSQKMWINTRWREKMGLTMPTTTDEYYEALKACRDKDPNGNGKSDEMPLMGYADPGGVPSVEGFLMCAFIYDPGGDRLMNVDGKVDVCFDKPEFKEGLTYLRKLYSEKLMDPQALTTPGADLRKLGEKEDAQVLFTVPALWPGSFQSMAAPRQKEYDAVPPLKGPKGVQLTGWYPHGTSVGEYAITKTCKCPEVAMRWVDWLYTMEGGLEARIGREGKEWRRPPAGTKSYNGLPATWEALTPINEQQNFFWGQLAFPHHFLHYEQSGCEDIYSPANSCANTRLYLASQLYEPYVPKAVVPPLWIPKGEVSRYAQYRTEVNGLVNQSVARFISGDLNLAGDWDNFLKQLNQAGLKDYLAIMQRAYDAKYKKS